jgi:hypothetical protein
MGKIKRGGNCPKGKLVSFKNFVLAFTEREIDIYGEREATRSKSSIM